MEALEELNVIIEVIFLQLARVDVLIMSYVPSSPGPQYGYQKVVMMLCCSSVVVLLFMSGCWLLAGSLPGSEPGWTVNQSQPGAAPAQTLTADSSDLTVAQ